MHDEDPTVAEYEPIAHAEHDEAAGHRIVNGIRGSAEHVRKENKSQLKKTRRKDALAVPL
jgi:hypothetical protein